MRRDLDTGLAAVRTEMAQVEQRLTVSIHQEGQNAPRWTLTLMVAMSTILGLLITLS